MRIDSPTQNLRVELPASALKALPKVGAQLTARVSLSEGRIWLDLGGKPFHVTSGPQLRDGDVLQLRVEAHTPRFVLKILSRGMPDPTQAALRTLLPRLGNGASAAQMAADLLSTPRAGLPADLQSALDALVDALPRAEELARPGELKRAMENSGLFLENALAASSGERSPETDLKALLLRAAHQIRSGIAQSAPTAPDKDLPEQLRALLELSGKAEAMLARLGLLQLQAVDQAQTAQPLLLELPVVHEGAIEPLSIQIEEEEREDDGSGEEEGPPPPLSVKLTLELDGLGPIYASIRLAGERINVFWAAREPEAADLIARNLDHLESRLRNLGLDVGQIDCRQGPVPQLNPRALLQRPQGLIDEKA